MVMELSAVDTLCVGSTCALSSLFYYLYRCQRAAVTRIQSAQRLQFDSDLKKLLEHSESRELGYVVLEGKVQAVNEALKSHFKPHLQAVIQRYQMTEHRLLWNSLTRSWSESKHIIHKQVDAIPFLLSQLEGVGDSVLISNPLNASGLCLETVHEEFHIPSPGFGEVFRHYLSGEKPTGLLETEEILPVGTVITGIGRLVLDPQGVLTLHPPQDGSEYFLSLDGYEGVLEQQESIAGFWKKAAIFCGVLGVSFLFITLYRAYRRYNKKHETQESWSETHREEPSFIDETGSSERMCVVCISQPRECVILPCGHVCCCFQCYQALPTPSCPMCRGYINRVVPLYQA